MGCSHLLRASTPGTVLCAAASVCYFVAVERFIRADADVWSVLQNAQHTFCDHSSRPGASSYLWDEKCDGLNWIGLDWIGFLCDVFASTFYKGFHMNILASFYQVNFVFLNTSILHIMQNGLRPVASGAAAFSFLCLPKGIFLFVRTPSPTLTHRKVRNFHARWDF